MAGERRSSRHGAGGAPQASLVVGPLAPCGGSPRRPGEDSSARRGGPVKTSPARRGAAARNGADLPGQSGADLPSGDADLPRFGSAWLPDEDVPGGGACLSGEEQGRSQVRGAAGGSVRRGAMTVLVWG